ncbi:MAG: hypothetical protein ACXIUZ_02040 [Lysobacteraceae bacterium]
MSKKFLIHLDLSGNEVQNAVAQNLGTAPGSPKPGQFYFDTLTNRLRWHSGTQWVDAMGDEFQFGAVIQQTAYGLPASNGTSQDVARADHTHGTPAHGASEHADIRISDLAVPTSNVPWNNRRLTGLADPVSPQDAVNKRYVDGFVLGMDFKQSVRIRVDYPINLSDGSSGVDGTGGGDGTGGELEVLDPGHRILLTNQINPAENGIYMWMGPGVAVVRTEDANSAERLTKGAIVFIETGFYAGQQYVLADVGLGDFLTSPKTFAQFGGGQTYDAGTGLSLVGSTFALSPAFFSGNAYSVSQSVGDGSATQFVVTHNLGTRDVQVSVRRSAAPYDIVETEVECWTTSSVIVRFNSPPSSNQYRVTVVGAKLNAFN